MGYAIHIDWSEEWKNNLEKWTNHGRQALESGCKHHTKDKDSTDMEYAGYCDECGTSECSAEPMMNYIYPLEMDNFDEEKILRVVNETNCTVMEDNDSGEWYLTLCGGGMDLSQDIAYAYLIMEQWIPIEFLGQICDQPELSIGKKKYKELATAVIKQTEIRGEQLKDKSKRWKERVAEWEAKDGK